MEIFRDRLLEKATAPDTFSLARRPRHKIMRAVLDTLLERPCRSEALVATNGRDPCEDATEEAQRLAHDLHTNDRTIQNRRAEWLRELRKVLGPDIVMLKCYLDACCVRRLSGGPMSRGGRRVRDRH